MTLSDREQSSLEHEHRVISRGLEQLYGENYREIVSQGNVSDADARDYEQLLHIEERLRNDLKPDEFITSAEQTQELGVRFLNKIKEEVRVSDPDTGAQKGRKPERYSLIPPGPLAELARLYGRGAEKYATHNWRGGYDWSLSFDALMRHAQAFWAGEDMDEETGVNHMANVAFHAFALMEFAKTNRDKDDRYNPEN